MTRCLLFAVVCCRLGAAGDPTHTAWIMSPAGSAALTRSLPEVHSVEAGEHSVIVRSAGISLRYFGLLQSPAIPAESLREFVFEIPIHPEPETGRHSRVPVDVMGTFVNGCRSTTSSKRSPGTERTFGTTMQPPIAIMAR